MAACLAQHCRGRCLPETRRCHDGLRASLAPAAACTPDLSRQFPRALLDAEPPRSRPCSPPARAQRRHAKLHSSTDEKRLPAQRANLPFEDLVFGPVKRDRKNSALLSTRRETFKAVLPSEPRSCAANEPISPSFSLPQSLKLKLISSKHHCDKRAQA